MQTTRQRILDQLETSGTSTALELSNIFRLTAANIRHHLSILDEEGLIEIAWEGPAKGRGRPTRHYRLVPASHGDNLAALAGALMDQIAGSRPSRQREHRLRALAERLGRSFSHHQATPTQRLVAAVEFLNGNNYRARWEARPDAPRLILRHCPYAAIIDNHPSLCQMDAYLAENLLGVPVEQLSKIGTTPGTLMACVFSLRQNKP